MWVWPNVRGTCVPPEAGGQSHPEVIGPSIRGYMYRHNNNSTPVPPHVHQVGSLITHQSVNTVSGEHHMLWLSVGAIWFEGGRRPVVVKLLGFLGQGFVFVVVVVVVPRLWWPLGRRYRVGSSVGVEPCQEVQGCLSARLFICLLNRGGGVYGVKISRGYS